MKVQDLCRIANEADERAVRAGRDRPILYGPYHAVALLAVAEAAREECARSLFNRAENIAKEADDLDDITAAVTCELIRAGHALRAAPEGGEKGER